MGDCPRDVTTMGNDDGLRRPDPAALLPGLGLARAYRKAWLRDDVAAGLVLTALLVPAGMGYAEAAGLSPVLGLYATVVPLVAYAVFGPSRILVIGPDSALAPLIAATVLPLAAGDPARAASLAAMLAIIGGGICVLARLARLGFLIDLLSKPVRYGYLNGIALVILVSQTPKLLGFSTDATGVVQGVRGIVQGISDGEVVVVATVLGLVAVAIILTLRRVAPRAPGMLLAVVVGILAVRVLGLDASDLRLVGPLPRGLPTFAWPDVRWDDIGTLVGSALGIALVSFTDSSLVSRTMAIRNDQEVDPNQELLALGIANVAAGFLQGFSISASSSRTPAAASAGARTQLTGVVGAVAILVLLVAAPNLFADLPTSVLAGIVICAALSLVEIRSVVALQRVSRSEFLLTMIAFAGIAFVGVLPGIAIAVGVSLLAFVRRAWHPYEASLVRVDGLKGYHDVVRHPEGRQVPGLLLYRFDAPLFFANAGYFREQVMRRADREHRDVRWVVVTAEPITDIDATAADAIAELLDDLDERGIVLAFAELKGHVRERLAAYGLVERIGPDRFYRTTGQAVRAYVAATGTPWTDWEDGENHQP